MATTWRTGGLFAAGLLVGVAVGGWAVIQARNNAVWQDNGPAHAMGNAPTPAPASTQAAPPQAQAMPVSAPAVPATVAAQSCDDTAIVPAGRGDGQESLQPAPSRASASEVASLILTGKEAAASGHMRDAEVVFLNACRDARVVQGSEAGVTLADAMYQLGRHYATVAQANGARKAELLARSQRMYQAALQTYQVRYGAKGEKTRFAQQGLATVQRLASGVTLPSAPTVAQAAAAAPARASTVKASAREEAAKARATAMASDKPAARPVHAAAKPPAAPPPTSAAATPATPRSTTAAAAPVAPSHDATPESAPRVQARAVPEPPKPAPAAPRESRPATASVDTSDTATARASADRPRPTPLPRATAAEDDTRPPAPPRDEFRRAPRSEESAGQDVPLGSRPTASGSAGDAGEDSN